MSKVIHQLLEILKDDASPIPLDRLHNLSDLNSIEMELFRKNWLLTSTDRRRSIIKEFGTLADENIELSFEIINRYALEDEDAHVRRVAIQNLWESEDPSLISIFVEKLKHDPSSKVRAAAADALGSFVLISETEDMDPDLKLSLEDALLQSIQSEQDERIHLSCLESLGYSSRQEVPEFIHQAYESGEEHFIRSALLAMGRSANRIWQEQVIKELRNANPELRLEAAQAAGELELKEALLDLIELLEDVNRDVKHAAIWSISQIGSSKAGEVLERLYDSCDDEEETQLLQDALDNFAFVEGARDFLLFNFDETEDDPS
jgi:HEAT repeat protein